MDKAGMVYQPAIQGLPHSAKDRVKVWLSLNIPLPCQPASSQSSLAMGSLPAHFPSLHS